MSNDESYRRYRDYFTNFLPGIVGQLLMEDLKSLSTCFEISVADQKDPPWVLVIEAGRLTGLQKSGQEPVCTFRVETDILLEIVTARLSPQKAFFNMDIHLDGDIEMGLRLSMVLEPFFQKFPYGD